MRGFDVRRCLRSVSAMAGFSLIALASIAFALFVAPMCDPGTVPDRFRTATLFDEEYVLVSTDAGTPFYVPKADAGAWRDTVPGVLADALDELALPLDMAQSEKLKSISFYLGTHLEYDYVAALAGFKEAGPDPWTFWCLLDGKAVCNGYVDAFQQLAVMNGVQCWVASGSVESVLTGEDVPHTWNLVEYADGFRAWVDCTEADARGLKFLSAEELWDGYSLDGVHRAYKYNGIDMPHADTA